MFVELEVGDAARSSKAGKTLVSKACEGTGRMDMLKAISTHVSASSFTGSRDIDVLPAKIQVAGRESCCGCFGVRTTFGRVRL